MVFIRQTMPNTNSKLRILHALPKAPNVDVYGNGTLIASNIAFGTVSNYFELPADTYEVQIFNSGFYDTPLLSQNIYLAPGSNYTVSIVALSGTQFLFKLRDAAITTSIASTYLRFINLSQNSPLLSLALPNDVDLFSSVEYLETTAYAPLSSGIYNFKVIFGSADNIFRNIKNLSLENGKVYTIYIIGLFNDKPPIGYLFEEDQK